MIIGIDHGYYAMKTPHICFPTGLSRYDYEPYTMQNIDNYLDVEKFNLIYDIHSFGNKR